MPCFCRVFRDFFESMPCFLHFFAVIFLLSLPIALWRRTALDWTSDVRIDSIESIAIT